MYTHMMTQLAVGSARHHLPSFFWGTPHIPELSTTIILANKDCIQYLLNISECDSFPAAKFAITHLVVQDSNGDVDSLQIEGDAKVSGGPGCSPGAGSIPPVRSQSFSMGIHPNPASSDLAIVMASQTPGNARLGIYDVRGRQVAQFEDRLVGASPQGAMWHLTDQAGRRVASGIYFARVTINGRSHSAPIVITR